MILSFVFARCYSVGVSIGKIGLSCNLSLSLEPSARAYVAQSRGIVNKAARCNVHCHLFYPQQSVDGERIIVWWSCIAQY